MNLDDVDIDLACRIIFKMLKKGVIAGNHHKQKQTISGWFASHEQGDVKRLLDDLATEPTAPVFKKGRGTVSLSSWEEGEKFLQKHGRNPPGGWCK